MKSCSKSPMEVSAVKFEVELPGSRPGQVIEEIREAFLKKVIEPFNVFFERYKIDDYHGCFEMTQEDLESDEIAWVVLYPFLQQDESDPYCKFASFRLDGRGRFGEGREGDSHGSWKEILAKILDFIKKELESLEEASALVLELSSAICCLTEGQD